MTAQKLTITIEFTSDWHVGMGAGRQHAIDRLIDRDKDHLPYVPASTVRGLWRDAAEQLAYGLDSGPDGQWATFVATLFGTQTHPPDDSAREAAPTPSRIRFAPARLADVARAGLIGTSAGHKVMRDALTMVKPGVKIDADSGMAEDDHLRFEEVAVGGLTLGADLWIDLPDGDACTDAVALLVASARLIERLGAKRRRGLGKCEVCINAPGMPLDKALVHLEKTKMPTPIPPATTVGQMSAGTDDTSALVTIELRLTLNTPTLVPDDILGNVVTTQHEIPGSYLLPIVSAALGLQTARDLIRQGRLRVSPARVAVEGQPSCPAPLCWQMPKDGKPEQITCAWTDQTPQKPVRGGVVARDGDKTKFVSKPVLELHTHSVIEDAAQRPTSDVGGVYSYEALSPEQMFYATVVIPAGLRETVETKLPGTHWIGRGKQAGYGRVSVEVVTGETTADREQSQPATTLDVWLTSDLLLSDDLLDPATTAEAISRAVGTALGVTVEAVAHAALRTRRVESWQRAWGLPRPTLVAVSAGSALSLTLTAAPTAEAIAQVERHGIGERRAEGFGGVRFNRTALRHPDILPAEPKTDAETEPQNLLAELLPVAERAWRRMVETRAALAASKVAEALLWRDGKPTRSQLGVLRGLVGRPDRLEAVAMWIATLKPGEGWSGEQIAALKAAIDADDLWLWHQIGLVMGPVEHRFSSAPEPRLSASDRQTLKTRTHADAVGLVLTAAIRQAQKPTK